MEHAASQPDALPFLACLQLTDSWFPSGLYTLSYGLETFAAETDLNTAELQALLADYVRYGVAPADGVALAVAHRASVVSDLDSAARADVRLTAVKLAREAREASTRVGRQLLTLGRQLFGGDHLQAYAARVHGGETPGNHAVILGLLTASQGIARETAVAAELHAFAASFLAAAVRLGRIDHRVAQAILHRLAPVIAEAAAATHDKDVPDIGSCVPRIDIMAMRHERAELRLFMS